jgi:HAUS augmin-like complex subunit 1
MANMAVELGMAYPIPESLASKFVNLKSRSAELEQTLERVTLLESYLNREAVTMDAFIQELLSDEYKPPADLAKQNLELHRRIKSMSTKLPELRQHVASLEKSVGLPSLTVEEVKMDEEDYLELLAKKKDLDAQVKAFAGLPPNIETARTELEAFRSDLRDATEKRDAVFEGLVERESPAKPRRRA